MDKILLEFWYDTPLGRMLSLSDDEALYLLEFEHRKFLDREIERLKKRLSAKIEYGETIISKQLARELDGYFQGKLQVFTVPFELVGTEFQKLVWQAVLQIPSGERWTYKAIAEKINKPQASFAVGAANGANQLALIVPCHRLVRTDGELAGYAGGLDKKRWLLNHESEFKNERKV
ncbi:methylated-DNA--[protein]-cysteine S-methyltransferase [Lactococcus allomyrinae]|nr:methylated-DNA--[protein]-cysteine S-methyltransferase [Lactococcus allomyrinae]